MPKPIRIFQNNLDCLGFWRIVVIQADSRATLRDEINLAPHSDPKACLDHDVNKTR